MLEFSSQSTPQMNFFYVLGLYIPRQIYLF